MRRLRLLGAVCALALAVATAGSAASGDPFDQSLYLTMRDGVRIAIDVWLPPRQPGRIPALVRSTRYWRAIGFRDPSQPDVNLEEAKLVTGAGYALVLVDVRGTGASFGTWPYPWSRAEIADLGQVVDWIVERPWSNGKVGGYGISYEGSTAEFLGLVGRPAVKAIVPRFDDFDPYRDIAFPGGIFTDWFIRTWNEGNRALDRNDAAALGAPPIVASARDPQSVLIGAWSHGAGYDADPFKPTDTPVQPSQLEQVRSMLRFLDPYLKGGAAAARRQIRYYTLGEGAWHTTATWPPKGVSPRTWYFGAKGSLDQAKPRAQSGADRYAVNFSATTGSQNRWHTQAGGGDVVYPGRTAEDRKLLTYTSAPLPADAEITGHPVVTLRVRSTATDGAFFVYLEDVAPSGRVTYLTEGELRALHRKVATRKPPYHVFGPYHTFERRDAEPLVPGRTAELSFALLPTSVLIRKGHRIRVAIAGADRDTFARIPARGRPVVTVERNASSASRIDLPVRSR